MRQVGMSCARRQSDVPLGSRGARLGRLIFSLVFLGAPGASAEACPDSKASSECRVSTEGIRTVHLEAAAPLVVLPIASGGWTLLELDGSSEGNVWGLTERDGSEPQRLLRFNQRGLVRAESVPCAVGGDPQYFLAQHLFVVPGAMHLSCGWFGPSSFFASQARRLSGQRWELERGPFLVYGAYLPTVVHAGDELWIHNYGKWTRVAPEGLAHVPPIPGNEITAPPAAVRSAGGFAPAWALLYVDTRFSVAGGSSTGGKEPAPPWLFEYDGIRWRRRAFSGPQDKAESFSLTEDGSVLAVIEQPSGASRLEIWSKGRWTRLEHDFEELRVLADSSKDRIWLASEGAVHLLRGRRLHSLQLEAELQASWLAESGALWVALRTKDQATRVVRLHLENEAP